MRRRVWSSETELHTRLRELGAFVFEEALEGVVQLGTTAAVVGEVLPAGAGRTLVRGGMAEPLEHPGLDPFWGAFGSWAAEAAAGA